jgi:hypothetical protein
VIAAGGGVTTTEVVRVGGGTKSDDVGVSVNPPPAPPPPDREQASFVKSQSYPGGQQPITLSAVPTEQHKSPAGQQSVAPSH